MPFVCTPIGFVRPDLLIQCVLTLFFFLIDANSLDWWKEPDGMRGVWHRGPGLGATGKIWCLEFGIVGLDLEWRVQDKVRVVWHCWDRTWSYRSDVLWISAFPASPYITCTCAILTWVYMYEYNVLLTYACSHYCICCTCNVILLIDDSFRKKATALVTSPTRWSSRRSEAGWRRERQAWRKTSTATSKTWSFTSRFKS